jgi:hypothetical protein
MATKVNLVVDQGADFTTTITLTNDDGSTFDLTDYSGASQIRKHYTSSNATNMSITLNGNSGIVTMTMNNSVTAAMSSGRYVYDLELTDAANVVSRIVEGTVTVTPQVTSS